MSRPRKKALVLAGGWYGEEVKLLEVLTFPHMAGLTDEARFRMSWGASEQIVQILRGERPSRAINNPEQPRYLRKE
ncbi:MAG: hypothetical protein NTY64_07610 [Deltaproteobacteria bacterium]|nr:hypothetical protein [Deltaproteobacteria bacterium]